ncbi:tectonic-2-like isoform X3 [Acipenser ruthenus]|uniref:tectonic-2-like isoform X3 n=1 Tax=Acipenser ruthenus TaxID=7906 RepID=UPI0027409FFF|nr:tectonic-2-like isoform X3 [Acipenser ruthenus]
MIRACSRLRKARSRSCESCDWSTLVTIDIVFLPSFIVTSGRNATSFLVGNLAGVTPILNTEVPSNSTGMLPPPSCTGNSSLWQLLTGERAGNSSLKVTVHLNQSLQLCGSNPNETSCCPESLCVVQSLRVTACRNNSVEATLLVQAEIYAETPTTGNVSENKTVIPNQVYQPLGSCPCDLQAGVCDIRCCCDQECTPSLIQLFDSYCYSGVFGGNVTPLFDQLCSVQTVNKAPDWFPFLCVQSSINNSPFLGLFYQGATINPIESPSFQTPSIVEPIVPNGYTQGSPILTENNQYFTIPQSMIGQCVREAPVAFLQNFKSSCVAPLTACNISQSACLNPLELSLRIINGQGGFINITVIEQLTTDLSDFVSDPNNAETLSPSQESLFPVSSNSGDLNASEQNGLCENKSLSLNYTFFWKGNSLTNITVIHLIGKVCLDANAKLPLTLTQRFSAVFVNGDATAQSNSGNPGYQIGKPVIAGNMRSSVITRTTLNVWQPVGNGLCVTAKTTPVLFGVDFASGCILRLSLKGLSNCSQTRETVQKGLSSLVSATIVAKRGNPVSTDLNEWVSISMALNMSSTAADNVPGTCTGVPANMNIQIITADVGVVEGVPQTEILAVEVGFTSVTWKIQCGGADVAACVNDSIVQSFPVSTSVTFIKIPAQPLPSKTRFQLNYTEYDCDRNDVCWPQLAYPLTRYYTGESYSQSIAKGMILVFIFIVASVLGSPWNQIRQAWNNTTF